MQGRPARQASAKKLFPHETAFSVCVGHNKNPMDAKNVKVLY